MRDFVKRSVFIKAERWFPPEDPRHVPIAEVEKHGDSYKVGTMGGWRTVHPGDYIVCDPTIGTYPQRPELFEKDYEQCPKTRNDLKVY